MTTITAPISLVQVAKNYGGLSHQNDALFTLQTYINRKNECGDLAWRFARMYRNSDDGSTINMIDVMSHYAGLPHQTKALIFLEENTPISFLQDFANIWRSPEPVPKSVNLNLPWDPQTDSRYPNQADRMCFSSSVFMCASYQFQYFRDQFDRDDDYLEYMLQYGDTPDPNAHLKALRSLGIKAQFSTALSLEQCIHLLEQGIPIAIGFLHHGTIDHPTGGGHYAALKGFTEDRNEFYLNDPYGSILDDPPYSGFVEHGRNVVYPRWLLNHRWTVETPGMDSRNGYGLYMLQ